MEGTDTTLFLDYLVRGTTDSDSSSDSMGFIFNFPAVQLDTWYKNGTTTSALAAVPDTWFSERAPLAQAQSLPTVVSTGSAAKEPISLQGNVSFYTAGPQ